MTWVGWSTCSTTCLRGLFRPLKRLKVLNTYSTYSITPPPLGGVSRLVGLHLPGGVPWKDCLPALQPAYGG